MLNLVLTCEHGGNTIPPAYAPFFEGQQELLSTHRGYDIGAKELFESLKGLAHTSYFADISRLLVELNRSPHHKELFSSVTKTLPEGIKQQILQDHYYPYRGTVGDKIKEFIGMGGQVLHLSIHTFTPVLEGEERKTAVGLLYDPKRSFERRFCQGWKDQLQQLDPALRVRLNYPYLGISDGFPTYLRHRFSDEQYMGIELEVNQKFPLGDKGRWKQLQQLVKESLQQALIPYKLPSQEK